MTDKSKLGIGDPVRIKDPEIYKAGHVGKIISIELISFRVEFSDGKKGRYFFEQLEKL